MIVFPSSPAVDDTFPDPQVAGMPLWRWDGDKWRPHAAPPMTATVIVSATPPINPGPDVLWFDSTGGELYFRFDDGDSTQWVATSAQWVKFVQGPDGAIGPQGPQGPQGIMGNVGPKGDDGPPGPMSGITYAAWVFDTPGPDTFTTPADSTIQTIYRFRMVGGGGGGGGTPAGAGAVGGGGGGGQFKEGIFTGLSPDTAINMNVGEAGTAGTNVNNARAGNGGDSTITFIGGQATANGGEGGQNANGGIRGIGGNGGTVSGLYMTQLLSIDGQDGQQFGAGNIWRTEGGASFLGYGARTTSLDVSTVPLGYGSGGRGRWQANGPGLAGCSGVIIIERIQG